jgi:hypothetical protein
VQGWSGTPADRGPQATPATGVCGAFGSGGGAGEERGEREWGSVDESGGQAKAHRPTVDQTPLLPLLCQHMQCHSVCGWGRAEGDRGGGTEVGSAVQKGGAAGVVLPQQWGVGLRGGLAVLRRRAQASMLATTSRLLTQLLSCCAVLHCRSVSALRTQGAGWMELTHSLTHSLTPSLHVLLCCTAGASAH